MCYSKAWLEKYRIVSPVFASNLSLCLPLPVDFSIHHIESCGSTNKSLQELLITEQPAEGLLVWADEQTAGRGHGKNTWESEAGKNLTFSLLLRPFFIPPDKQFILTQIVSLALIDLLREILPVEKPTIKWPNDIYIGDKKVAGILIQNFIKGQSIDYSIVGIGLNVNQQHFLSDAPNPVSLIQLLRKPLVLPDLLDGFLTHFRKIYGQSASLGFRETIRKDYLSHLFRYRQQAVYSENGVQFRASIQGVGKYGRLVLKLDNGTEKLFSFKEIEFVI